MESKKAVHPVIATALLIVVAVITLVLFNTWFSSYSSDLMADVETQSSINAIPEVEGVIGDFVYIKTSSNLTVDKILVDGDECDTNISMVERMQAVNISSCLSELSTSTPKITLITGNNIVTESVYLKDAVIGSSNSTSSSSATNSKAAPECYSAPINTTGSWEGCMDMLIVDRDMLINAQWFLPTMHDRYITYNGINYTFGDNEYNIFTGQVTDMSGEVFYYCNPILTNITSGQCWTDHGLGVGFSSDISYWDVSNSNNMSYLFGYTIFNLSINNWNVSSVINMDGMFSYANSFNQPFNNWDTSSVTSTNSMFEGASSFNQPLNNWDVSNVENMQYMFLSATSFNQPLNWNVSSVINMLGMFQGTTNFNQFLDWNTSTVNNMRYMFRNAINFNQSIDFWNVSNVNNMEGMFWGATNFYQNISSWCVQILSKPLNFDVNSGFEGQNIIQPQWDCP